MGSPFKALSLSCETLGTQLRVKVASEEENGADMGAAGSDEGYTCASMVSGKSTGQGVRKPEFQDLHSPR